jgi:plastocyanin
MNRYLIALVAFVALVAVVATGYLLLKGNAQKSSPQNVTAPSAQKVNSVNLKNLSAETIMLTSTGFQPQTLNINAGTRVVWQNNSGGVATVNSDNYPTNLLYPFLNFGQFNNGATFSTVFQKAGTYTYYNFLNQSQKGTVIVK